MDSDITALEQEKKALEESIAYKQTDAYIEEKARNELNLVKPNEELYLVPGLDGKSVSDTPVNRFNVLGVAAGPRKLAYAERKENILRWFELFF